MKPILHNKKRRSNALPGAGAAATPPECALSSAQPGKKSRSRVSIRRKLLFSFFIYELILLAVLWLCQVVFLEHIYKAIKIAEIKSTALELTANTDSDNLQTQAETVGGKNEVCVLILVMLTPDSAVRIADVNANARCLIHNMSRDSVFKLYDLAKRNGGSALQRYRYDESKKLYYTVQENAAGQSDDEESIVYTLIRQNSDGKDVLCIFNSVISPVGSTVRTLHFLLLAVSGLVFLLAVVLTLILSARISGPIIRINRTAKELAKGNYAVDFHSRGYREISELGDTLNYAASELSKTDQLRRELIANVSHDLRTPLTLISGYAEVIRDLPGENTPENIQIIIDETQRLTSLVNDMLDISKLQSGTQRPEFSAFNLTDTLRGALKRYNKLIEQDHYHIDFFADRDITVQTDRIRFQQVFYNLVNNAVTHTGADKQVTVRQELFPASGTPSRVRVSVTDTGEGIAPEQLPLIWDRYYKVDKVHKRAAVGTGLGLSIVKTIMELLHGSYGVVSTPGQGSTFWVELPLDPSDEP